MKKIALIALGLMAVGSDLQAATYYFSTSGNNTTGTGTQTSPFYSLCGPWSGAPCTTGMSKISTGQIIVQPGDSLLFRRGDEWVGLDALWTINTAGTVSAPVTFGAYGNDASPRPIFRGSKSAFELGRDGQWANVSGTAIWYLPNIDWWPNLAAQEDGATQGPHLFGATSLSGQTNANAYGLDQSMVRGTFYYDFPSKRLYVWRTDNLKPDHAAGRDIFIGVEPNDGTDRLVKVIRPSGVAGGNLIFQDLHVKLSKGYGFATSYPNTKYINVLSELNGMEGIIFDKRRWGAPSPGAKDGLVKNSIVRYCAMRAGNGIGQAITIESENVWVEDTEVYENAWAGIDFLDYDTNTKASGGVRGCKVHNNGINPVQANCFDPNIYVDGGSDVTIENTQLWGAGIDPRGTRTRQRPNPGISIDVEPLGFSLGKRPTNIKIRNVLAYANAGEAVRIGGINGNQGSPTISNVEITGSTLHRNLDDNGIPGYFSATPVDAGVRVFRFNAISGGLKFKNNIVLAYNTSRAPMLGNLGNWQAGKGQIDFETNMYFCPGCDFNTTGSFSSGGFFSHSYIVNMTLDQWRNMNAAANLRQDAALLRSLVISDPAILNTTTAAFNARLSASSLALDRADASLFPSGMSGTTRADNLPDSPYNDLGFHYPLASGTTPPPAPDPDPTPAPDTTAPTAPTGFQAVLSGSQINMSWTAATDDTGVTLYRVLNGSAILQTTSSLTATMAAAASQTYNLSVVALDAAGNASQPSTASTVVVPAPPAPDPDPTPAPDTTAPSVPAGLTAALNNLKASLTWNPSTDDTAVSGYEVYDGATVLGRTDIESFTTAILAAGSTHSFTVKAYDAKNNMSAASAAAPLTVPSPEEPAPTTDPAIPSDLVGSWVDGEVRLGWTPGQGAYGYNVTRDGAYLLSSGTPYNQDRTAQAGQTYVYRVQAFNIQGQTTDFSAPLTFKVPGSPDTQAPSIPNTLRASADGLKVTLEWDASTDNEAVTGYKVFSANNQVAVATGTTATIDNLSEGTVYSFKVAAVDAAGNVSPFSQTIFVQIPIMGPVTPLGLAAEFTGTSVKLTWLPSVNTTGYTLLRDGVALKDVYTTFAEDTSVALGMTYKYQVQSFDHLSRLSPPTAEVIVTTPNPDRQPPSVPANVKAAIVGPNIQITWGASTDNFAVTGYRLQNGATVLGNFTSTTLSYTMPLGNPGTVYSFTVAAFDAADNVSAPSAPAALTLPGPAMVQNLMVFMQGSEVRLSWSSVSGAQGYNILRDGNYLKTVGTPYNPDTTAVAGKTYKYQVQAYDSLGRLSTPNAAVTFTVPGAVVTPTPTPTPAPVVSGPPAPTNFRASRNGNAVTVNWNASAGGTIGYNVYKNGNYLKSVGLAFANDNLATGVKAAYKVKSYNVLGQLSAFSNEVTI